MKHSEILKAAYGTAGVLENLVTVVRCFGASGPDVMYYLSRILGVAFPLPVALAIRAAILATSGYCFLDSVKKISPKLYRKLKASLA